MINLTEALTYDDVMLVPKRSTVKSRSDVDMSVILAKGHVVSLPFVPANMSDVVGIDSIKVFHEHGCLAFTHRFGDDNITNQMIMIDSVKTIQSTRKSLVGCSVGVKHVDRDAVQTFVQNGVEAICIDVAHGDSDQTIDMVKHVAKTYPSVLIVAGNVATGTGAKSLWEAGADCVKVGIGPGSICTTRKETGNGVPQMTALEEIHQMRVSLQGATGRKLSIIADGGIKSSGDCVKALCFADLVMIGGMFASTVEAPGTIVNIDGKRYKKYSGSSTHKSNRIEGTMLLKQVFGNLGDVITNLTEGVQSGCSYQNAHKVRELKYNPKFVRVSSVQQSLDQNKETFRG